MATSVWTVAKSAFGTGVGGTMFGFSGKEEEKKKKAGKMVFFFYVCFVRLNLFFSFRFCL
ncbi:hypothetical protein BC829DRAFT_408527, partial [Chytridium lagenaria]